MQTENANPVLPSWGLPGVTEMFHFDNSVAQEI